MIRQISPKLTFQGALKTDKNNTSALKEFQKLQKSLKGQSGFFKHTNLLHPEELNNVNFNKQVLFLYDEPQEKTYTNFMNAKYEIKRAYNSSTQTIYNNHYTNMSKVDDEKMTTNLEKKFYDNLVENLRPFAKKYNESMQKLVDKYLNSAKILK